MPPPKLGPRILLINANWLGDVLFSTPALRAIRKQFPKSYLACLVPYRCEEVLAANPNLDRVLVYDDRVSLASPIKFADVIFRIRRERFDTAIFFHRSKTKSLIAALAGIKERIGYRHPSGNPFLTYGFEMPRQGHRTDYYLDLLSQVGIDSDGRFPDFFPKKEVWADFNALCLSEGLDFKSPYVVVHAGGNWALKRWPERYFVEWIRSFLKKYPWKVVMCGTQSEYALVQKIADNFDKGQVLNLAGKSSLSVLALLLKHAKMLLSNDSGPIHLAASQGTAILGVYGPTSADLTGPQSRGPQKILQKDIGCEVPCYFRSCNYRICMEWLTPAEVLEAAQRLLETA